MTEYCGLCGQFVEVVPDRDVRGISKAGDEEFDLLCDRCVHQKLNFGKARQGGCLYCEKEAVYVLRSYGVSGHINGHSFFAKRDVRPIICEEHFDVLDESDDEEILSIDDALNRGEQIEPPNVPIPEAIGQEEDEYLEYKETFQYNVHTEQQDKNLKSKTVKEVAALGNSAGGVVVIGVRDGDKEVTGLERDYASMGEGWDGFARQVRDVIRSKIGDVFTASYVSIERCEVDESVVCVIRVDPGPKAVFVDSDNFYVRQGSSSQPLSPEDAMEYIATHWEN